MAANGNLELYVVVWQKMPDSDGNAVESVASVGLFECVSNRNICYKSCVILKNGSQSIQKKS